MLYNLASVSGFEPLTFGLTPRRSTTELNRLTCPEPFYFFAQIKFMPKLLFFSKIILYTKVINTIPFI